MKLYILSALQRSQSTRDVLGREQFYILLCNALMLDLTFLQLSGGHWRIFHIT